MRNMQQLMLYDRIYVSFLKNAGDFELVRADFPDIKKEYIWEVVRKIRAKQDGDTRIMLANNLARIIYNDFHARTRRFAEMLGVLDREEVSKLSICHGKPVTTTGDVNYCMDCGHETETYIGGTLDTIESKRKVLESWRLETETLVKLALAEYHGADKTFEKEAAPQGNTYVRQNIEQNIVMLESQKKLLEKIHDQSPSDRERIIQDIQRDLKKISYQMAAMDSTEGKNGQPGK